MWVLPVCELSTVVSERLGESWESILRMYKKAEGGMSYKNNKCKHGPARWPNPFVAKDKPEQTLIIGKALPRTHGNIVKLVFITFI